jgi:hypothetical protein
MAEPTKDAFFSPTKMNALQKAESTHLAAMAIIDAESVARDKKTERLRQARMEREALGPAEEPTKRRKGKA